MPIHDESNRIARSTQRTIKQNKFMYYAYNMAAHTLTPMGKLNQNASAAILEPQIAHLAVIAERLESIVDALTRPPPPIPPTPNGNGHNGASLPPPPDEHTDGEDDPAR
jgi:hypothetical protein